MSEPVNDMATAELVARAAFAGATAATRSAAPAGPDSMGLFLKEGTAIDPEKGRALLTDAIDSRTNAAIRASEDRARGEANAREWRMANEMALQSAAQQAPEILQAENQPKFGAMIAKVKMEAEQKGVTISPLELTNRAVREFKTTYGGASTAAPEPPRLESASRTGLPGTVLAPVVAAVKNGFETFFKMKAGTIQPITDPTEDMDKMTKDYVRTQNKYLMDRKLFSSIPAIDTFMEESA